jgi:hypothetical protein
MRVSLCFSVFLKACISVFAKLLFRHNQMFTFEPLHFSQTGSHRIVTRNENKEGREAINDTNHDVKEALFHSTDM